MLRFASLLLVVALLPANVALAETAAAAPEKAFVVAAPSGGVQIAWLAPVGDVPDSYRVYGYTGATANFLTETNILSASVPAGYASYAVTAVYGVVESAPATADACFSVAATLPPQVGIDPDGCL